MTLLTEAWLIIPGVDGPDGEFQLQIGLEETTQVEKDFIMANRGQYLQEIVNNEVVDIGADTIKERRSGFYIDGGAGQIELTVQFETGLEDVTWGDGSGGTGQGNVTETDASGAGVKPLSRKQVLEHWIASTRTDSLQLAQFHWGEWTNGTVGTGNSAGAFGQPIPVVVAGSNIDTPQTDQDSTASLNGTLELRRAALFPGQDLPGWVQDRAKKLQDAIEGVVDR